MSKTYEDLINRLREATSFSESRGYSGMANTIKQAADAIEELQVEIPPHGRLVDTDVVIDRIDMNIDLYGADFTITLARMRNFIEHAPTFMEAEEGEA